MADFTETIRDSIDAALAERDRAGALTAALDAVDSGNVSIPDLYTSVLGPLLTDTGFAWQRGAARIWEEHYATAVVRSIVESLAPKVIEEARGMPPRDITVLLACPSEEHHDLGLRMLFDRFLLAGYSAHFLGADTPVAEICHAAEALGAKLVVLSASTHYHRVRLREVIDRLKRELPPGTRIAVGGPAFERETERFGSLLLDTEAYGLPGAGPHAASPEPGEEGS